MDLLAGLVVTAVAFAIARKRARIEDAVATLQRLRAFATGGVTCRRASDDDVALVAALAPTDIAREALVSSGFTELGVVVAGSTDRAVALRLLVDPSRRMVAILLVTQAKRPRLYLQSYARDDEYMTRWGAPEASLATPPFVHVAHVPRESSLHDLLERHRRLSVGPLLQFHDLDALIAEMNRRSAMHAGWRETLAPDELIDLDARALLGTKYERLGKRLRRRLSVVVPEARVRR